MVKKCLKKTLNISFVTCRAINNSQVVDHMVVPAVDIHKVVAVVADTIKETLMVETVVVDMGVAEMVAVMVEGN